jgi:sporulation protein YlmC with PRC-barrel domain
MLTGRGTGPAVSEPEVNERWLDGATLSGLEVMGEDGNSVGRLVDATFDQDSLEIEGYLLRRTPWERLLGRPARLQPARVMACSRELMIVSRARAAEAQPAGGSDAVDRDQQPTVSVRVPLKADDRVPAPSFDAVPDGQTVRVRPR